MRFVTSSPNRVHKQWVRCYGHGPRNVLVSVGHMHSDVAHTQLRANVLPLVEGEEMGFVLVLHLQTDLDCNDWTIADCAPALQAGLWPCVSERTMVLLRKLSMYRKWIFAADP